MLGTTRAAKLAAVGTLATLAFAAGEAAADDRGTYGLADDAATAEWTGEFHAGAVATAPPPEVCAAGATCDVGSIDIDLPAGTWDGAPGGMSVAIQWPNIDFGHDLDLHVYAPDGTLAGSSDTTAFSRTESVWVENPQNGTYRAVVAPKGTWAIPQDAADALGRPKLGPVRYRAFVDLDRGLTIRRTEFDNGLPFTRTIVAHGRSEPSADPLLPDLIPTTPREFHMETGQGVHYYFFSDRDLTHQPSCYPQEMLGVNGEPGEVRDPVLRCLRWDQGEFNFGDGPLELHNYPDEGDGDDLYQRVYHADGSVTQDVVGESFFSSAHGHFHALGFQDIALHERNPDGTPGAVVARTPEKGICMVDIEDSRFGDPDAASGPHAYELPGTCDTNSHTDPNDPTFPGASFMQMGISVGHADVYPWFVADQYLDVTDVPDGRYVLRVEINGTGLIHEKSLANNETTACVELRGETAGAC